MSRISLLITAGILSFSSCVTIPKETIELSKVMSNDIHELHRSHKAIVNLYYSELLDDIDIFVEDVYAPYIINYVLQIEFQKYEKGNESLYETIESAGKAGGKESATKALRDMNDFVSGAQKQIEKMRKELKDPISSQQQEILSAIDNAYNNVIYANSTITGYLESIRKVKEAQKEALSLVGLEGKDDQLDDFLLKTSKLTKETLVKAKEIDILSDEAEIQIKEAIEQFKKITNK